MRYRHHDEDKNCKGKCREHYSKQSFYKIKTNFMRVDNVIFNFSWLGFKKCKSCLFVAITNDKLCFCCGFRFSMKRPKINNNNYKPYDEEGRQICDYNYHMMPGFAEMRQKWFDEAIDKSPYIVSKRRRCLECNTNETLLDENGKEIWFRRGNNKDHFHYICRGCYKKEIYKKNNLREYHRLYARKKYIPKKISTIVERQKQAAANNELLITTNQIHQS